MESLSDLTLAQNSSQPFLSSGGKSAVFGGRTLSKSLSVSHCRSNAWTNSWSDAASFGKRGQFSDEQVEGLFSVRPPFRRRHGGRSLAVGAAHGGQRGTVAELKPRVVGPGGEATEGIDELPNGLVGVAQSDQAHCVVDGSLGADPD